MKRLHDKVNVIPLIAKADTLTPEECQLFKKQVFVCIYNIVLEYMDLRATFNNEMPSYFSIFEVRNMDGEVSSWLLSFFDR